MVKVLPSQIQKLDHDQDFAWEFCFCWWWMSSGWLHLKPLGLVVLSECMHCIIKKFVALLGPGLCLAIAEVSLRHMDASGVCN